MEHIKSIRLDNSLQLNINPTSTIEYVFWLKARIKAMQDEIKEYDAVMMNLINVHGGKYEVDFGKVKGTITKCKDNHYEFSEDIKTLEEMRKMLDNKIKAKKLVEIASGAEMKSSDEYLRYNIKLEAEE